MEISINIQGKKTFVTFNGETKEYKTAWLKSMTMNDFILYISRLKF